MTDNDLPSLPAATFAGGTKAITLTPIVGTPRREYAETFVPGEEALEDGELRVTVLGSGNPWATRAQASASILVEVGNPERDLLVFDLGCGALANYASLELPVNLLDKVFLSHLHADHTADMITLCGSYAKVGRADGPVRVWGPSGTEPRLGTRHFVEGSRGAGLGHGGRERRDQRGQHAHRGHRVRLEPDGGRLRAERRHGDVVPGGPRGERQRRVPPRLREPELRVLGRHLRGMAAGARQRGRRPADPRVLPACRGARGGVGPLDRAGDDRAERRAHLADGAGKVFGLVRPRMAGLWHTLLSPQVIAMIYTELRAIYDGPVVQTQDLTVFNVTKEAVVARQAQVMDQLPPTPGTQRATFVPKALAPPEWWAEARIPLEE